MWARLAATRSVHWLVVLASALTLRSPDAQARPKPYWMISFAGGVLAPVGQTADAREPGLGVGMRVGYTGRIGFGIEAIAQYAPLQIVDPNAMAGGSSDVVTDNHFVSAALLPRYTLGRGVFRLSLGAGGGGIIEQTRSRQADDPTAPTNAVTVIAPSAVGEVGIETHFWDSGGLVVSSSYVRSFHERELEVASVLGGLVFTFR